MSILHIHFLRPMWLLALIPLAYLCYRWSVIAFKKNPWQKVVDAHLLPQLLVKVGQDRFKYLSVILLAGMWAIAVLALAGPAWSRLPQSLLLTQHARVIAIDMSQTMEAEDIAPNRYTRARFKALDILNRINEGQVGLIAFSSEPYVVSPLTEDAKTISELMPELQPGIMPTRGSDIHAALESANQLFTSAGISSGQIIVVTASPVHSEDLDTAKKLQHQGASLFILGMDPHFSGDYKKLARAGNGQFFSFTDTDEDVRLLLAATEKNQLMAKSKDSQQMTALWRDEGRGLLLFLLPLVAIMFRRGWFEEIVK